MFKSRTIDGVLYQDIAIKFGYRTFQWGVDDINSATFSVDELTKYTWDVMLPDTDAEEKTEKLRDILKDSHYLGASFQKIDNMNIREMFHEVIDKLKSTSDNVKYRLIKRIIEDKLYKE